MNKTNIKQCLYKGILIVGASFSLISIIGNWISAFPLLVSIKWIVLLCITMTAFLFSNNEKYTPNIMFGVFLFLVACFLPFAFMDSGGSDNNAMGYTFLLLIAITYLFVGWRRILLVVLLILSFMAMHAAEYYFPELIAVFPDAKQFVDRMIQMPLLLFASFFVILRFAKEYERVNLKLETYANYDALTGLFNRRVFDQAIEDAMKSSAAPIYLVLFDLDNFKGINDRYGHSIGDEALIKLSSLLKESLDLDKHVVSRWGGDEFAIIYFGNKTELMQKLEEIRQRYHEFVSAYEVTTGMSVSVVSFDEYDDVSKLIVAADRQLYNEKLKKP